jgi:hypothetical protein
MLYREIIAVCSQIHTKHVNTLCGQNVTPVLHTINDQQTCRDHDICHSQIQLVLQRSCMQHSSHFSSSFVRSEIDQLSVWGAPQGHHDIPQTREESDRTRESCRRAWTANKPSGRVRMLVRTPNSALLQTEIYSGGHQYWTRIPTVHQDKQNAEVVRPYLKSLPKLILSFQTRNALGGPVIESRFGWDFLRPFRPALEPTQPPA